MDKVHFANGVALSLKEEFLVIAETVRGRLFRLVPMEQSYKKLLTNKFCSKGTGWRAQKQANMRFSSMACQACQTICDAPARVDSTCRSLLLDSEPCRFCQMWLLPIQWSEDSWQDSFACCKPLPSWLASTTPTPTLEASLTWCVFFILINLRNFGYNLLIYCC